MNGIQLDILTVLGTFCVRMFLTAAVLNVCLNKYKTNLNPEEFLCKIRFLIL